MKVASSYCLLVSVLLAVTVEGKGITTRISIRDVAQGTTLEITDPRTLEQFNVWAGPGTFANGVEGRDGFIIDWPAGVVTRHPSGLRRHEVQFYVRRPNAADEQLAYIVTYDHDPTTGEGFVYLPGRSDAHYWINTQAILRGNEGHWFRASARWLQVMRMTMPAR